MSDAQPAREPELFEYGETQVFCFNPGGRFHSWLLQRHGDGKLYPIRELRRAPYVPGTSLARLLPPASLPSSGARP